MRNFMTAHIFQMFKCLKLKFGAMLKKFIQNLKKINKLLQLVNFLEKKSAIIKNSIVLILQRIYDINYKNL